MSFRGKTAEGAPISSCVSGFRTDEAEIAALVGSACRPVFEMAGYDVVDCLACGTEGCIFKLADNKIAKVTPAPSEPMIAGYLINLGDKVPSSLPVYYGVWELPELCFGPMSVKYEPRPVYLIVREDIADLTLANAEAFGDEIYKMSLAAEKFLKDEGKQQAITRAEYDDIVDEITKHISYSDRWAFDQLRALYDWFIERGIVATDVHAGNLGRRIGDSRGVVIRDLGYSEALYPDETWKKVVGKFPRSAIALSKKKTVQP